MTVLVVKAGQQRIRWWQKKLQKLLPDVECRVWDDMGDLEEIDIAVVWSPEPGILAKMKNLRLIVSIGAGIDHITRDPDLPSSVPIIRTVNEGLRQRMREYIIMHVTGLHRKLFEILRDNLKKEWNEYILPTAQSINVGFMGLGNMGLPSAISLCSLGYNVSSWTRSRKKIENISSYVGKSELDDFLRDLDIVICMLPLTIHTENIINKNLLSKCKDGVCVINAGRGDHLVDADLLQSIEDGKVSYAVLDSFREEPLPKSHPFWESEKIILTMHTAGFIDPDAGGEVIAHNIKVFLETGKLCDQVDLDRGY